jgi:hypothetical protein
MDGQLTGTTTVPEGSPGIESIEDVIVRVHTAVGKSLQGVATRQDGDVDVHYQRDDVEETFADAVAEVPPAPAEPGYVTYGDDDRQLLWLTSSNAGMGIALDRDASVNAQLLAEALYECGIGDVELDTASD